MPPRPSVTVLELFRVAPAKSALLTVGPPALAVGQLTNSYLNGLSPALALAFAAVMVTFAVVATGHHAAEHRRDRLESEYVG